MIIHFNDHVDVVHSMVFDECYEKQLKLGTIGAKELDIEDSFIQWMFVDGKLAGEIYGIPAQEEEEWLTPLGDNLDVNYGNSMYCLSLTLLPEFRGKGLSKIMKVFWMGTVRYHYRYVIGHAACPESISLNKSLGAIFSEKVHENWFDTKRQAIAYKIDLGL